MATAREQLAQLDREFNAPHSAMHVDEYRARHDELLRQAAVEREEPAAALAPAAPAPVAAPAAKLPLDEDPAPLSRKLFFRTVLPALVALMKKAAESRDALERRVAALEARPVGMRYRGNYDGGIGDYAAGDVTTFKSMLWYCAQATKDKPGESPAWKLMHRIDGR